MLALLLMLAAPTVGSCADEGPAAGFLTAEELSKRGFKPLVSNEGLSEWDVKPWHEGHWINDAGIVKYDGKAEHKEFQQNSLWTRQEFGDFEFYAEWRLPSTPQVRPHPIVLFNGDFLLDEEGRRITRPRLDAGDSGVMFRGVLRCQANIWSQELGSGEINGYRTDKQMPPEVRRACIPIRKADNPLGEWNAFLITLIGDAMQVELNGSAVIEQVRLPDLPARGPIGLQHHGDDVEFRNLWVKPLP